MFKKKNYSDSVPGCECVNCTDYDCEYNPNHAMAVAEEEHVDLPKGVDPFIYYAREMVVDKNKDTFDLKKVELYAEDGTVLARDVENCTVYPLKNAAIVGSKEYPLGMFVPFSASIDTLQFVGETFDHSFIKRLRKEQKRNLPF